VKKIHKSSLYQDAANLYRSKAINTGFAFPELSGQFKSFLFYILQTDSIDTTVNGENFAGPDNEKLANEKA